MGSSPQPPVGCLRRFVLHRVALISASCGPRRQVVIEGCGHGELDKIYSSIKFLEEKENIKIDLLICCGDFQVTVIYRRYSYLIFNG